jgi:hypothetical protein
VEDLDYDLGDLFGGTGQRRLVEVPHSLRRSIGALLATLRL